MNGGRQDEPTRFTRLVDAITTQTTVVIVSILLLTAVFGVGIAFLEYDSSLEQFESETKEAETLEYATANFSTQEEANTTVTAVIVSDDDALAKESLLESLEFQQALHENETVTETLAADSPTIGVENVVATSILREDDVDTLVERRDDLEERADELDETETDLRQALESVRGLEADYADLNASYENDEIDEETYQTRAGDLDQELESVREEATTDLEDDQTQSFDRAMGSVRAVQSEINATERAYADGEIKTEAYDERTDRLENDLETAYTDGTVGVLGDEYDELWAEQRELEDQRDDLESLDQPPLEEQISALESIDESAYERHLEELGDEESPAVDEFATTLLPSSYEVGDTQAEKRLTVLRHAQAGVDGEEDGDVNADTDTDTDSTGDRLVESELAVQQLAADHGDASGGEYVVFGPGIVSDEIDRAIVDSLIFVGPLALGVVLVSLAVAYRDPIEVALGVAGIGTVLVWTLGFMGWAGITFNQLFVAIPVLLIGLSIDYAIHVFMRHRESRETAATAVRPAMALALTGVGVALLWVTATTAIGFLSNLVSPIAPLREFGLVSTVGIVAALLVFGGLMPAIKIELDESLERRRPALGIEDGPVRSALSVGASAARVAPLVVLVLVLAVTAGGLYAAGSVDTNFDEDDLLAENPSWTEHVSTTDRDYQATAGYEALEDGFEYRDAQAQIVVSGDVTDGDTLERVDSARMQVSESESTDAAHSAGADDQNPLTVMESVATEDESFNASFHLADRTGDGVPNQNLEGLYDHLFESDPEAASEVIHRTSDGEYESVRLLVSVRGDAPAETVTSDVQSAAAMVDDGGADERWNASATGPQIVEHTVEESLLDGIFESLVITLVAVFGFLTAAYYLTGHSASLGIVTLLPVALAVCWIVGTMALLGIPFNILTGTVTSLTIGLGVAYNIHVSSRFVLERRRRGDAADALSRTMAGTGGALFGSVATTTLGFTTLALAFLPAVRQFGFVTALTIAYAFFSSILVLPTLLLLWARYVADGGENDDAQNGQRSQNGR
ncbi:Predicted exporter protein, RND superfamily [Natronorubrum sediminis]|uniref:Predicted exporter protein, RND superfamily n=1 Tax=Natronorubrum sediminis TaxID=640943 RepID=A0A1H6FR14_9EURY|nr:MMPL family transporter [Natronorubrum sediminis]SEH12293.1 Predicted exporter protein, RND superfamily [Natronorubrum sediminis]